MSNNEYNKLPLANWAFLHTNEQNALLAITPNAERVVNNSAAVLSEKKFHPCSRRNPQAKIYLPPVHVFLNEGTGYATRHWGSWQKTENCKGIYAIVRKQYLLGLWTELVLECMADLNPALARLKHWKIYEVHSDKTPHLYLETADKGKGVNNGAVSLYIPYAYFTNGDYSLVEEFHDRLAVGYYRNFTGRETRPEVQEWEKITAAAPKSRRAKNMRKLVENRG